jgi:hypothetical protein
VRVVDGDAVLDARLALEAEDQGSVLLAHVLSLQGGEAEAAVLVGVHVVADPEVPEVEQSDGGRACPGLAHAGGSEVGEDLLAGA